MKIVGGLAVSAAKAEPTTQPQEIPTPSDAQHTTTTTVTPLEPSYTIHYAPTFKKHHSLARAADFDARLSILEQILGASTSFLANLDKQTPGNAVIPTLDDLARQISVLTSSSPTFVDALSRRVKLLADQAEKLAEARRSARQAAMEQHQQALASTSTSGAAGGGGGGGVGRRATLAGPSAADSVAAALEGGGGGDHHGIDPANVITSSHDRDAKINALYGTLPTITTLSPLLPPVLDRLRSLRAIHADTGRAAEGLERIEKRQEEMAEDIRAWREALGKVEGVMRETEGVFVGNVGQVEKWVRELEGRLERLETTG
ncbi:hypothetical protein DFH27DRAFT_583010 [Peziza echinospora]|nr:hypothetical protein DFH27DRAFT_583010 [Peziza echinospora]